MALQNIIPLLSAIGNLYGLPPMEFAVNFLAADTDGDANLPLVSYCKRKASKHFLIPRYYFNRHRSWEMGRGSRLDSVFQNGSNPHDLILRSGPPKCPIATSHDTQWDARYPVAVFRGAATNIDRVKLCRLSQHIPHLVDAGGGVQGGFRHFFGPCRHFFCF